MRYFKKTRAVKILFAGPVVLACLLAITPIGCVERISCLPSPRAVARLRLLGDFTPPRCELKHVSD